MYDGQFRGKVCVLCWTQSPQFAPLVKLASNKETKATVFIPTEEVLDRLAAYYCLPTQELMELLFRGGSAILGMRG